MRPTGLNGHLRIKDSTLTCCQKGAHVLVSKTSYGTKKNQQWQRKAALYSNTLIQ